jgi:hypothetical protein
VLQAGSGVKSLRNYRTFLEACGRHTAANISLCAGTVEAIGGNKQPALPFSGIMRRTWHIMPGVLLPRHMGGEKRLQQK